MLQAIRAMERAHVVVMMIDADDGPAEQDARILGLAEERGRATVIALNKMDLLDAGRGSRSSRARERCSRSRPGRPSCRCQRRRRARHRQLLGALDAALAEHEKRVTTGQLNRFFAQVLETHPPPTSGKRPVRLYFVTQAEVRPPTFVAVTNRPEASTSAISATS